jgi:hypothetical protein
MRNAMISVPGARLRGVGGKPPRLRLRGLTCPTYPAGGHTPSTPIVKTVELISKFFRKQKTLKPYESGNNNKAFQTSLYKKAKLKRGGRRKLNFAASFLLF